MKTLLALFLISTSSLFAQVAASQVAIPWWQPLDNNGRTVPGGKICTYETGTYTPQATFTSASGGIQLSNPIILNSAGEAQVWWGEGLTYRVVFQQPGDNFCPGSGAVIWTADGISNGGSPAPPFGSVQFNNSGTFGGNANFEWFNSSGILEVCPTLGGICNTSSGVISNLFDCTATGSDYCVTQATGTFGITGAGNAAFQSLALTNGWTAGAGAWSLTAGGVLTVSSCTGCGGGGGTPAGSDTEVQYNNMGAFGANSVFTFNSGSGAVSATDFDCVATGSTYCIQQQGGTFTITGAGNAAFQSLALTNGLTVDSGTYGLSGTGALTVSSCSGCGGSGSPGAPSTSVQFNNSGAFAGNANFLWNNSTGVLEVCPALGGICTSASSVISYLFNCSATGSDNCVTQSSGTFGITGAGNASFQSLALTNGLTVDSGTYGLTGLGALTVSSCSGCGVAGSPAGSNTQVQYNNMGAFGANSAFTFNSGSGAVSATDFDCVATGSTYCIQQQGGTFTITGAGNAAFQSLALTNGLTVDSGSYGLTGMGALTVASCTGCGFATPVIHSPSGQFNGGGLAMTPGLVSYVTVPYSCTIGAWDMTVDTGTATIDVWKIGTGTAIPTVANTITASALPAIASGTALHSTTLTGWTTSVVANDIFAFELNAISGATQASLVLQCQ